MKIKKIKIITGALLTAAVISCSMPSAGHTKATDHLSNIIKSGVAGFAARELESVYAFPVPFTSSIDEKITFTNLPPDCTIKIYTVTGELTKELTHSGSGQIEWSNIEAESGVYLYVISKNNETKKGKIIIIK
jgi:hypothetical protein